MNYTDPTPVLKLTIVGKHLLILIKKAIGKMVAHRCRHLGMMMKMRLEKVAGAHHQIPVQVAGHHQMIAHPVAVLVAVLVAGIKSLLSVY